MSRPDAEGGLHAAVLPMPLRPLALLLRTLPDPLHTRAVARVFNALAGSEMLTEQATALEGRSVGIVIRDTGNRWCFRIAGGRLQPMAGGAAACEVRIHGDLADFLRLALRLEDPDTLFFHRRLSLEGATETGLAVKNLLDGMEVDWRENLATRCGPVWGGRIAGLVERSGAPRRARHLIESLLGPGA